MRDVLYVAVVIGFFGLSAAYVSACVRIVGDTKVDEALIEGGDVEDRPAHLAVVPDGDGGDLAEASR